jgi:RNA polymerase sigma-70 factor (ECF subfamily)
VAGNDAKESLFQDVVASNQRRIQAIARSYAHGEEQRDLCQEILLQMWKGLDGFQGKSAPSTWVYRVALNTAITYCRKNGRRVEPGGRSLTESGAEPVAPSNPANAMLILEEFLHSLSEIDRAVFLLYLDDLGYREISEVTGLKESHVGVRINRLKRVFTESYCGG